MVKFRRNPFHGLQYDTKKFNEFQFIKAGSRIQTSTWAMEFYRFVNIEFIVGDMRLDLFLLEGLSQ